MNSKDNFRSPIFKFILGIFLGILLAILIGLFFYRIEAKTTDIANTVVSSAVAELKLYFDTDVPKLTEGIAKSVSKEIELYFDDKKEVLTCDCSSENFIENDPEEKDGVDEIYNSTLKGKDLYNYFIISICDTFYPEVDPYLIMAMVEKETGYDPALTGALGEQGLMQIMPKYFSDRMNKLRVYDLYDPYSNLLVGIDYVNELLNTYGVIEHALMVYNGGPVYARDMIKQGVVSNYASGVIKLAEELRGGDNNA